MTRYMVITMDVEHSQWNIMQQPQALTAAATLHTHGDWRNVFNDI